MLVVACVEAGDYQGGRGREYVERLYLGCLKWMQQPFLFQVLTDSVARHWPLHLKYGIELAELGNHPHFGKLNGWWHKIELFCPRMFPSGSRILYLDLDVIITGGLDDVAAKDGIVYLRDWGWQKDVFCSSTMVWRHGDHSDIWHKWDTSVPQRFEGDQDWITHLGGWKRLQPDLLRSYRYHCKKGVPDNCRVVAFHGKPKPHEVNWRI